MAEEKHVVTGSQQDFDELMAYMRAQQQTTSLYQSLSSDEGFTTIALELQKYTAEVFLEKASEYISKNPVDLVQASEKIWGAVCSAVKKIYFAIEVDVVSHKATRHLFQLAARLFDGDTAVDLVNAFAIAEKCHKNFYDQTLEREEVMDGLKDATFIVNCLKKVVSADLRTSFNRMTTSGTNAVQVRRLPKSQERVLGEKTYTVQFTCY